MSQGWALGHAPGSRGTKESRPCLLWLQAGRDGLNVFLNNLLYLFLSPGHSDEPSRPDFVPHEVPDGLGGWDPLRVLGWKQEDLF